MRYAFSLIRSFLRWVQEERLVPLLFQRVLFYEGLLRVETTRLAEAAGGLGLGGGGAPGITALWGQQAALAPGLLASTEGSPGAPLHRGARVFGHDIYAPAQPAVGPIINIATGPAAHGPLFPADLMV
jgi:hypothetical protein